MRRIVVGALLAFSVVVAVAAAPAVAASVSIENGPCSPDPSGTAYCFDPPAQTASSGDAVTWTNNSFAPHTITRCTVSVSACPVDGGTGTDAWTGSGEISNGQTYSHTFTGAGTYVYYCAVHGYAAMHGTITVTASNDPPPTASFSAPSTAATGQAVTFDASASHANGDTDTLTKYVWTFGDGSPALTTTNKTTAHLFGTAGAYSVTLKVIDNEGASATETQSITITGTPADTPPTASFTFSPPTPQTGQAVTFDASATGDPDGDAVTGYAWNFGDGTTAGIPSAITTHTYAAAGTFTVTLVATDANGEQSAAASDQVTVVAAQGSGGPPPGGGGSPPGGSPSGGSPPGGANGTVPSASKPRLAPNRLCRHKRPRCNRTKAKLTFTLSAAASVTVVIEHNRQAVRRSKLHGRAGMNSIRISSAGLRPSRYRLVLTPAGGKSVTLKFVIMPA
jgi:plastocyanin